MPPRRKCDFPIEPSADSSDSEDSSDNYDENDDSSGSEPEVTLNILEREKRVTAGMIIFMLMCQISYR
jgi:hypothetical protein